MVEGGDRRALGEINDGKRDRGCRGGVHEVGGTHRVANPQPGKPVCLGESPEHDEIGIVAEEWDPFDGQTFGGKLDVGLVEQHQHGGRHHRHEMPELLVGDDRACRIVRATNDDDARALRDRRCHGGKVMAEVWGAWYRDTRCSGDRHQPGIRLEAPPAVDHLVAGSRRGTDELSEHRHRAGADMHLVGCHTVPFREARAQNCRRGIRIPVDGWIGENIEHGGKRGEVVLVGRQLERVVGRRISLPVRGHCFDGGAEAHAGSGHTRQPNCHCRTHRCIVVA